ncbi:MAG: acyltransferase [Syntrophaceae bacterium]
MSLAKWLLFFKRKVSLPTKRDVANRSSEAYIAYLRRKGVRIGHDCEFFKPATQFVDPSNPELITIGNKVKISLEVAILTHGFDYSVLRELHPGECFGSAGPVTIGDNVFIGMRSTILKDTTIGSNCVIGAGSLVKGCIPDNTVAVGNPARVIMSIDELYHKYKLREVDEARQLALSIFRNRGTPPTLADFTEYFYLFASAAEAEAAGIEVMRQVTPAYYERFQRMHKRHFASFAEFIEFCGILPEKR